MAHGLDHLVLPVRDLEAAAAHYRALGFQVGARNRHPWGTENRLVQLQGAFLELITFGQETPPAVRVGEFSFGAFVADFLIRHGDGFGMIVVESKDAVTDNAAFTAAGIGGFEPFYFERKGLSPSGAPVDVAFTLAFAQAATMPDIGFFACQQHKPENFWSEDRQRHENGATKLSGVIIVTEDPMRDAPFIETFSKTNPVCVGARNAAFTTPRGSIELMTPECFADVMGVDCGLPSGSPPRAVAFRISMPLEPFVARCEARKIPVTRWKRHAVVPATANFGAHLIVVDR